MQRSKLSITLHFYSDWSLEVEENKQVFNGLLRHYILVWETFNRVSLEISRMVGKWEKSPSETAYRVHHYVLVAAVPKVRQPEFPKRDNEVLKQNGLNPGIKVACSLSRSTGQRSESVQFSSRTWACCSMWCMKSCLKISVLLVLVTKSFQIVGQVLFLLLLLINLLLLDLMDGNE